MRAITSKTYHCLQIFTQNLLFQLVISGVIIWNNNTSCRAWHKNQRSASLLILSYTAEKYLQGHVQLYSVNNPQNSKNGQLLLAWCWVHWEHVKEQPVCVLLERDISAEEVFFISATVREYEEEREHLSLKLWRMPVSMSWLCSKCV